MTKSKITDTGTPVDNLVPFEFPEESVLAEAESRFGLEPTEGISITDVSKFEIAPIVFSLPAQTAKILSIFNVKNFILQQKAQTVWAIVVKADEGLFILISKFMPRNIYSVLPILSQDKTVDVDFTGEYGNFVVRDVQAGSPVSSFKHSIQVAKDTLALQ